MARSDSEGETRGGGAAWLPPALLTAYLLGVALATAPSTYSPVDLLMLAGLYALAAVVLHTGLLVAVRLWAPLGVLAALGVGAVLVWHLREQTFLPDGVWSFAASSAALGIAYTAIALKARRAGRLGPAAAVFAGAALLFAVALAAGFQASNTFRWHLLRHNKLIGTPAYYLLSEPIEAVSAEVWAQHAGGEGSAPVAATVVPAGDAAKRPHIVFVLLDTLRADALSAYDGDPELMPALNRFAAEALVFRDVLSNAPWTRPSVASLFTGMLPEHHGAVDRMYLLSGEHLTLAEILAGEGYTTAAFVSNFAAVGRDAGFAQGFGDFFELAGETDPYARAEQVNAAVGGWLASRGGGDGPLFLYVHYLDPHPPYLSGAPDSPRPAAARRAYEAEARYLDRSLGGFFDMLEAALSEPPIVFVISDHGEEFGEHGSSGHGHSLYDEVIRLPALLRAPGSQPQLIPAKLEARDFFDLLLQLSRRPALDVVAWAEERSRPRRYTSVYLTTSSSPHRPYMSHTCMRGIEEDGFFLIWSAYGSSYELYDVDDDPAQKRNVARTQPERVRVLRRLLEDSVESWARLVPIEMSDDTVQLLRALGYME
jgi:arylsulfatase A-like enzyme